MDNLTFPLPFMSMPETSTTVPVAPDFPSDVKTESWLLPAIEEYRSIRTESLDSMKVQNTILSYGITTVGLILTAGISIIDKEMLLLNEAMFLFFIPLVTFFIVMIWAGEVARMYRAGCFLAGRESIINQYLKHVSPSNPNFDQFLTETAEKT